MRSQYAANRCQLCQTFQCQLDLITGNQLSPLDVQPTIHRENHASSSFASIGNMAVGKNKTFAKGGKKGAKKKQYVSQLHDTYNIYSSVIILMYIYVGDGIYVFRFGSDKS
jgi:hypothetical protein